MNKKFFLLTMLVIVALASGCAAPIIITAPATEPLKKFNQLEITSLQNQVVGEINQKVIDSIMIKSINGIIDLKRFSAIGLQAEVPLVGSDKDIAKIRQSIVVPEELGKSSDDKVAVLQMTLLSYKKGNAFLRFLFGMFAGSGEVSMEMKIVNKPTKEVILKATTSTRIQGAYSSESVVINPLSLAIVKFVKDNFK